MSGHQINVRFEAETVEQLDRLGKLMDRPRAWLVQMAVRQLLEREMGHVEAIEISLSELDAGKGIGFAQAMDEINTGLGIEFAPEKKVPARPRSKAA
jgi:predicted transcriptional regulator